MVRFLPLAAMTAMVAMMAGSDVAQAGSIPGLYNTGVDASGNVLPFDSVDPYWTVSQPPAAAVPALVGNQVPGAWLGADGKSDWISPGDQNTGTFDYATSFTLSGAYNPALVSLSGLVAVDNEITGLLINGNSVGFSLGTVGNPAYSSFEQFNMLGDYTQYFVTGLNTIDFEVYNDGGPTGLRVEWTSSIPEPAALAAFGVGIAAMLMARRRAGRAA